MNKLKNRVLHINDFLEKEEHYTPISTNHNTNYNKRFKSGDKRKHSFCNSRLARYEAYLYYRKINLPDQEEHINYISFVRVLFFICREILREMIDTKLNWVIPNLGQIKITTIQGNRYTFSDGEEYNKPFVNIRCNIFHAKKTSNWLKRFKFKLSTPIKDFYKVDFALDRENYLYKRTPKLITVRT